MAVGTPTRVAGPIAQHIDNPGAVNSSTTGSFTPTAGALLVAVLTTGDFGGAVGTNAISNTHAGTWSWTQLNQIHESGYSRMSLFYAIVPASPGAGTITFTYSNNREQVAANVYEITGIDAGAPIVQSKLGIGTGTSRSVTLNSSPAGDSLVFALTADSYGGTGHPTIGAGSGYTTLHQTQTPGIADNQSVHSQYRNGGAGTAVSASSLSGSSYGSGIIAIEIKSGATSVDATATPVVVAVTASLPTAAATAAATAVQSAVTSTTTLPSASVRTGVTVTPASIATVTTTPAVSTVVTPPDPLLYDSNRTGNFEIYRVGADGSATQLTNDTDYDTWWPKPSPDGTKILFCRTPAGVHDTDFEQNTIWIMDSDGSNATEILPLGYNGWTLMGHPAWSPDGSWFVCFGGGAQLYIVTPDGASATQISVTGDTGFKLDPSVSPSFNVYYKSLTDNQIYSVFALGGTRTAITANAWDNYDPYVSPDGTKLAWLVNVSTGVWSIRIADPDGTNADWLINDGVINSKPQWSDDSSRIYFHRTSGNPYFSLHWMPADGSTGPTLLEVGAGSNEYPVFSPAVAVPATVTPSVIATTSTCPSVTMSAGSTAARPVVATVSTLPAATVTAQRNVTVTATVIATVTATPATTTSTGATTSPTAVATTVATPTVTVGRGQDITPTAVATESTFPSATVLTGLTATPAVIATASTLPDPTVATDVTVTPAAISTAATVEPVTLDAQTSASVTPAAIVLAVAIAAAEVEAVTNVAVAAVHTTLAISAPDIVFAAEVLAPVIVSAVAMSSIGIGVEATRAPTGSAGRYRPSVAVAVTDRPRRFPLYPKGAR